MREQKHSAAEFAALDNPAKGKAAKTLRTTRDAIADEAYAIAVETVALAERRETLCRAMLDALLKEEEKRTAGLESTENEVALRLREMGDGPEDHPQYAAAPAAIRIQFGHRVRASSLYRQQAQKVETAKTLVANMRRQVKECANLLKMAQNDREATGGALLGIHPFEIDRWRERRAQVAKAQAEAPAKPELPVAEPEPAKQPTKKLAPKTIKSEPAIRPHPVPDDGPGSALKDAIAR